MNEDPKPVAVEAMLPLHMATNTPGHAHGGEREEAGPDPAQTLERDGGPARTSPSLVRHADHFHEGTWLPHHRADGTLPPHFGERMVLKHPCSPYPITIEAFVRVFGTSDERRSLLRKFLVFRRDLRAVGVTRGFHYVGGSMVERSPQPPSDVDVVTFFVMPDAWADEAARRKATASKPDLFDKERARVTYGCDAYLIQLALKRDMFRHLTLWTSLFGHDRDTNQWKGFCEIDLDAPDDDRAAAAHLA